MVCRFICKKTHQTCKLQMCFFIVYLLKIITSITKANTIIVSTIKPNKSRYIISNKTASIIAPPPSSQHMLRIKSGKPHLLILISYVRKYSIRSLKNQYKKNKNSQCFKLNSFKSINYMFDYFLLLI